MADEDGGSLAVVKAVGGSALWAAGAAGSYVGGAISSYVAGSASSEAKPREGAEPACLRPLGGGEILRIANTLNGIFATSAGALKPPEVPRLVVVGTQSSGKSSLLNGIMAADILPLGEQMVTRAPLSLQLFHAPDPAAMRAEFGDFSNGAWRLSAGIPLQCPEPTAAQLEQIRRTIEEQTESRAGSQKGVSHEPIFLRIYSPYVPNLSLVDLPGLTMTARTRTRSRSRSRTLTLTLTLTLTPTLTPTLGAHRQGPAARHQGAHPRDDLILHRAGGVGVG
jgi:hypothetical protein